MTYSQVPKIRVWIGALWVALVWGQVKECGKRAGEVTERKPGIPTACPPGLQALDLGLRRILQVIEVWHSDSYSVLDIFGVDY